MTPELPYVDQDAIGAVGVSHGGEMILKAAAETTFAGKDSTWVSFDHPDHGYPFIYRQADGAYKPDAIQQKAFELFMDFFDGHLKR